MIGSNAVTTRNDYRMLVVEKVNDVSRFKKKQIKRKNVYLTI